MQRTLLLTGFEPFGKWTSNPSWEIAAALDGETSGDLRVVSRKIPVNWTGAWPALQAAIESVRPDVILMLGLAGKRPHISVESIAYNECDETPDNEGNLAGTKLIIETGKPSLPATLPVDAMVASIEALGLHVVKSEDAGRYLCNHTLYRAATWAAEESGTPVGFIHVPNVPEVNPEGIPLSDQIRAVQAAISAIASNDRTAAAAQASRQ